MSSDEVMDMTPALVALLSFSSVLYDCNILAQTMLQWLAYSPMHRVIDAEIGTAAITEPDIIKKILKHVHQQQVSPRQPPGRAN